MTTRVINIKFKTKCNRCKAVIENGETVTYNVEEKRVYCRRCKPTDESIPVPIPEPEFEVKEEPEVKEPDLTAMAQALLSTVVKNVIEQNLDETVKQIKESIEKELVTTYGTIPKVVVEINNGKETKRLTELTHEKFADVLQMVNNGIPVFLVGEAGCGKNVICQQIAEALSVPFYFSNAVTNEYKITGFIDANGKYHETQFYQALKDGGLFFLDELDAGIPEVLVLLNAAIANRYFNFPCGKVDAHPDFRVIAAGNTYGWGASMQYVGRYQLDAASLDRFVVVTISYDNNIEDALADGDKEIVEFVRITRDIIRKRNIKYVMSYRAIQYMTKLSRAGMSTESIIRYAIVKGMSKDDINIINSDMSSKNNKYIKAFKGMAR